MPESNYLIFNLIVIYPIISHITKSKDLTIVKVEYEK